MVKRLLHIQKYSDPMMSTSRRRKSTTVLTFALVTCAVSAFSPTHDATKSSKRKLPSPTSSSCLFVLKEPTPKKGTIRFPSIRRANQDKHATKQGTLHVQDPDSFQDLMSNRTDFEMAMMSTLSITVPTFVVLTLAMASEDTPRLTQETNNFFRDFMSLSSGSEASVNLLAESGVELFEDSIEQLEVISYNVFDAAVPTSATDLISVALGEGIAATLGGIITSIGSLGFKTKGILKEGLDNAGKGNDSNSTSAGAEISFDGFVASAVADTDYFITRAAATPLLAGFGLPPILGVIVATIPSQLIKLSARQRQQRRKEDELLQTLLLEEKGRRNQSIFSLKRLQPAQNSVETASMQNEISTGSANQVDFVEIFSDVTKWLEYDVLINSFNGMITFNNAPVSSGVESAVYGFLVALSSQLWADAIYRFTDYGLDENREAARARSAKDTLTLYVIQCSSAATLFGVYESARAPISRSINSFLSGGVDNCLGSSAFDICIQTFNTDNPASATVEGQVRALFVTAANIAQRLDGFSFSSIEIFPEDFRALAVQLYSIFS